MEIFPRSAPLRRLLMGYSRSPQRDCNKARQIALAVHDLARVQLFHIACQFFTQCF